MAVTPGCKHSLETALDQQQDVWHTQGIKQDQRAKATLCRSLPQERQRNRVESDTLDTEAWHQETREATAHIYWHPLARHSNGRGWHQDSHERQSECLEIHHDSKKRLDKSKQVSITQNITVFSHCDLISKCTLQRALYGHIMNFRIFSQAASFVF